LHQSIGMSAGTGGDSLRPFSCALHRMPTTSSNIRALTKPRRETGITRQASNGYFLLLAEARAESEER
jgi:hypothetical protein